MNETFNYLRANGIYTQMCIRDRSSLAPEGKPVAFCLDPETGFSWIGEYDITADELLSGAGGNTCLLYTSL